MDLDIGLSLMVGNGAYRNAFLKSGMQNVSKAAIAALEHLDKLAFLHEINRIEFAFPYPYGRVKQLNEKVGRKVDAMMEKYQSTVHLPMAPIHTLDGAAEVIAGFEYGLTHGTKQFVIHPAEVEWKRFWRKSVAFDHAEAKRYGLKNLGNTLEQFKDKDIIVGIENLAGDVPYGNNPSEFACLFGRHDRLTAGWCLDTCHAVNSGLDPLVLIDEYKNNLVEVHLTDTKVIGGQDKHCALGQGEVPLRKVKEALRKIKFDGPVVVEVGPKDFRNSWGYFQTPDWSWFRKDR